MPEEARFQELTRAERCCVNAVELASVLIVGLDRAGRIQLFNREAERVTGFPREEVIGQPFLSALNVEDPRGLFGGELTDSLTGRVPSRVCDGTVRTRAGKLLMLVWDLAFAGEQVADDVVVVAVGRDLTEVREMEERARQAEKLAVTGKFAAGLAHEIRNPLNGAQLHLALLDRAIKRNASQPEMLESTQVVAQQLKRLAELVTEFLELARSSGPTPMETPS
jgi:PAS domain S-box-containing protein